MLIEKLSDRFLGHCAARGLSQHTIRAYRADLMDFEKWYVRTEMSKSVTTADVSDWLLELHAKNLAATSIKRKFATLKVFLRWSERQGLLEFEHKGNLDLKISTPRQVPRNIPKNELEILLRATTSFNYYCDNFAKCTLKIALELLIQTVVRVSELCSIRICDIDFASEAIFIKGKGNRERLVFILDSEIKKAIISYIQRRSEYSPDTDFLLITCRAKPVTPEYIRKHLHAHASSRSIGRRVTPHMLRHSAATLFLDNGVDIRFVQRLLGHASISTTEMYTHVNDLSLREALRSANSKRLK